MPEITIQDSTFARLQQNARPLVDTIDTVMNRALDALERVSAPPIRGNEGTTQAERQIDPRAIPSLTHTKVLDAAIDGEPLAKANWNTLLESMLRRSMKRVGTFEKLRQVCPVAMVKGSKNDEGYSYLSDIDVSVQGQDSNSACRMVVTAAQSLGMAVDIGFMWRHKDAAAYPGERARLHIAGANAAMRRSA
jgi:hypothetical protein